MLGRCRHNLILLALILASGANGQITLEEIALHASNDDCWSAAYGEVYDVTDYAPSHPNDSVYAMCGKEATSMFDAVHGDAPNYLDIFPGILYLGSFLESTDPSTVLPTLSPTPKLTASPTITPTGSPTASPARAPPDTPATPVASNPAQTSNFTQTPATPAPAGTSSPTLAPTPSSTPNPTQSQPQISQTPTYPSEDREEVTVAELKGHSSEENCWVAIHGGIYEFTHFMRLHPGGRQRLLPCCGSDCTATFDDQHPLDILENYGRYFFVAHLERAFSAKEMSSYNFSSHCLVSYFGRVFNVTAYLDTVDASIAEALKRWSSTRIDATELPCGGQISLSQFAEMSPGITEYYVGSLVATGPPISAPVPTGSPPPSLGASTSFSVTFRPTLPHHSTTLEPSNGSRQVADPELAMHSSAGDCWSIYFGDVYDLTSYVHPGGQSLVTGSCGRDGTEAFTLTGHPESYMSMISQYKIGAYASGSTTGPAPSPGGSSSNTPASMPVPIPGSTGNGGITQADLLQHASSNDCWSVYFGEVYDMSNYNHPGGASFITGNCGADATSSFTGIGHPQSYMSMVSQLRIGVYAGGSGPAPGPVPATVNGGVSGGSISMAELSMHRSPNDCWVAYYGEIYDVTSYASRHPGGSSLVTANCGSEGTAAFSSEHGRGTLATISGSFLGNLEGYTGEGGGGGGGGYDDNEDDDWEEEDQEEEDNDSGGNGGGNNGGGGANNGVVTPQQLSQHPSSNDCWVAYFGEVYDVTNYAPNHPAGSSLITRDCGGDGTNGFSSAHGRGTLNRISGSFIGPLEGYNGPTDSDGGGDVESDEDEDEDEDEGESDEDDRRKH